MGALARSTRDRPDPGELMPSREIRIEDLLGARVRDAGGRTVGRIEEIRAVPDGDGLVVTHYLLGPTGWRARLSLRGLSLRLRALRGAGRSRLHRVPWQALDVSDPRRPVLRLNASEAASRPAGRGAARRPPRSTSRAR
jgi:hypothetical protein